MAQHMQGIELGCVQGIGQHLNGIVFRGDQMHLHAVVQSCKQNI